MVYFNLVTQAFLQLRENKGFSILLNDTSLSIGLLIYNCISTYLIHVFLHMLGESKIFFTPLKTYFSVLLLSFAVMDEGSKSITLFNFTFILLLIPSKQIL